MKKFKIIVLCALSMLAVGERSIAMGTYNPLSPTFVPGKYDPPLPAFLKLKLGKVQACAFKLNSDSGFPEERIEILNKIYKSIFQKKSTKELEDLLYRYDLIAASGNEPSNVQESLRIEYEILKLSKEIAEIEMSNEANKQSLELNFKQQAKHKQAASEAKSKNDDLNARFFSRCQQDTESCISLSQKNIEIGNLKLEEDKQKMQRLEQQLSELKAHINAAANQSHQILATDTASAHQIVDDQAQESIQDATVAAHDEIEPIVELTEEERFARIEKIENLKIHLFFLQIKDNDYKKQLALNPDAAKKAQLNQFVKTNDADIVKTQTIIKKLEKSLPIAIDNDPQSNHFNAIILDILMHKKSINDVQDQDFKHIISDTTLLKSLLEKCMYTGFDAIRLSKAVLVDQTELNPQMIENLEELISNMEAKAVEQNIIKDIPLFGMIMNNPNLEILKLMHNAGISMNIEEDPSLVINFLIFAILKCNVDVISFLLDNIPGIAYFLQNDQEAEVVSALVGESNNQDVQHAFQSRGCLIV